MVCQNFIYINLVKLVKKFSIKILNFFLTVQKMYIIMNEVQSRRITQVVEGDSLLNC